jgi:hypothetical protein
MGRTEEQEGTAPRRAADPIDRARAFFDALWDDYVAMTPRVAKIRSLFTADNPRVDNDHVAFRTFAREPIRLEQLERHFLEMGYERHAPYAFESKKLDAWGYVPPPMDADADADQSPLPRVFLSELRVDALSHAAQRIIDRLCASIDPARVEEASVFHAGPLWPMPSWDEYSSLLAESEYAAWLCAMGMRANHFTVSVNSLRRPTTLAGVVARVEGAGFVMNTVGGTLKGTPEELLEQASTVADRIRVCFGDGTEHEIPSAYYEFARRYPASDGTLYPGFVAASADRLFESTHVAGDSRDGRDAGDAVKPPAHKET